jgi:uncharacterized protein (AIM24 family)
MSSVNWTRENIAWAAGLFEGEGCINEHHKGSGTYWILFRFHQ